MEKTDLLLHMMEHPDDYSERQWDEILADENCRELYALLADMRGAWAAMENGKRLTDQTVRQEWQRMDGIRPTGTHGRWPWRKIAAAVIGMLLISGLALAAFMTGLFGLRPTKLPDSPSGPAADVQSAPAAVIADTLRRDTTVLAQPKHYDNVPLHVILTELAAYYGLQVRYGSGDARLPRLYFKWDPADSPEQVVELLNHFETFHLTLEGRTLTVELPSTQP